MGDDTIRRRGRRAGAASYEEREQKPVKQPFYTSLRRNFHTKCFLLSSLIYGCLTSILWCRLGPPSPSSSSPASDDASPVVSFSLSSASVSGIPGIPEVPGHHSVGFDISQDGYAFSPVPKRLLRHPVAVSPLGRGVEEGTSGGRRGGRTGSAGGGPCDDVYLYIPIAFIVMLYFVYLVECWHCHTRIDLRCKVDVSTVYQRIAAMRRAPPIVWWKAVCYHYTRRARHITRYRNGEVYTAAQGYYERVNTHTSTSALNYSLMGVRDASKHLVDLERYPATRIYFSKGFSFESPIAEQEFTERRAEFLRDVQLRDDYTEFREGVYLLNATYRDQVIAFANSDRIPWYVSRLSFWIASLALLSWPLRALIEYRTATLHYHVHKLFGCNYVIAPDPDSSCLDDQSTTSIIGDDSSSSGSSGSSGSGSSGSSGSGSSCCDTLSAGLDRCHGDTMGSSDFEKLILGGMNSLVPSYSEALLMDYCGVDKEQVGDVESGKKGGKDKEEEFERRKNSCECSSVENIFKDDVSHSPSFNRLKNQSSTSSSSSPSSSASSASSSYRSLIGSSPGTFSSTETTLRDFQVDLKRCAFSRSLRSVWYGSLGSRSRRPATDGIEIFNATDTPTTSDSVCQAMQALPCELLDVRTPSRVAGEVVLDLESDSEKQQLLSGDVAERTSGAVKHEKESLFISGGLSASSACDISTMQFNYGESTAAPSSVDSVGAKGRFASPFPSNGANLNSFSVNFLPSNRRNENSDIYRRDAAKFFAKGAEGRQQESLLLIRPPTSSSLFSNAEESGSNLKSPQSDESPPSYESALTMRAVPSFTTNKDDDYDRSSWFFHFSQPNHQQGTRRQEDLLLHKQSHQQASQHLQQQYRQPQLQKRQKQQEQQQQPVPRTTSSLLQNHQQLTLPQSPRVSLKHQQGPQHLQQKMPEDPACSLAVTNRLKKPAFTREPKPYHQAMFNSQSRIRIIPAAACAVGGLREQGKANERSSAHREGITSARREPGTGTSREADKDTTRETGTGAGKDTGKEGDSDTALIRIIETSL